MIAGVAAGAITDWLSTLQGASFVGVLIVTTFAGLQRGQIQNLKESQAGLRGDRDDLNLRFERSQEDLADERAVRVRETSERDKKIAELTSAVEVLRATVTGEAHLVTIEGQVGDMAANLAQHHIDAMAGMGRLEQALSGLADAINKTPRGGKSP